MRVFFRLGDTQLGALVVGQILPEHIVQYLRRIGAGGVDIGSVFREHHEITQQGPNAPLKILEVIIDQGPGQLPGPVCTEIHEQHHVTVVDQGRRFALALNHRGLHKFIVLVPLIGRFQPGAGAGAGKRRFGFGQQPVGTLDPIPAVVAVHGIEASAQGGDPTDAVALEKGVCPLQRGHCAAGRGVPAVQKGM